MLDPFMHTAKVVTMQRDFNELRKAIRSHDSFAAEAAWENCERWLSAVTPQTFRRTQMTKLEELKAGAAETAACARLDADAAALDAARDAYQAGLNRGELK